jgi:hypothetical protein
MQNLIDSVIYQLDLWEVCCHGQKPLKFLFVPVDQLCRFLYLLKGDFCELLGHYPVLVDVFDQLNKQIVENTDSDHKEPIGEHDPPELIDSHIRCEQLVDHVTVHPSVELQHPDVDIRKEPCSIEESHSKERECEKQRKQPGHVVRQGLEPLCDRQRDCIGVLEVSQVL